MSEAGTVVPKPAAAQAAPRDGGMQNRVAELKVSGHLMTLDTGVFCVFQAPGTPAANDWSGLPGVRISLPPGPAGRPDAISISTFRDDGWMNGSDTATLIRVAEGPAQVLVTVYQSLSAPPETAPRLQVMRLGAETHAPAAMAGQAAPGAVRSEDADVVAHVQRTGDIAGKLGDWVGTRGSQQWIEGFSLAPREGVKPADIEYQAVLGRGWLSPWIEGGKFCGSRGMALPLAGPQDPAEGQRGEDARMQLRRHLRRRQFGRADPGRRDLRSREPGGARGVSGDDPPPWRRARVTRDTQAGGSKPAPAKPAARPATGATAIPLSTDGPPRSGRQPRVAA